jgi:hypothetical protein
VPATPPSRSRHSPGRALLLGGVVALAWALFSFGAVAGATSAATIGSDKQALTQYVHAHAPSNEQTPTQLSNCPLDTATLDRLAATQPGYQKLASNGISGTVHLDQSVDVGTLALVCTVPYNTKSSNDTSVIVAAYADPGIAGQAFGKQSATKYHETYRALKAPSSGVDGGNSRATASRRRVPAPRRSARTSGRAGACTWRSTPNRSRTGTSRTSRKSSPRR